MVKVEKLKWKESRVDSSLLGKRWNSRDIVEIGKSNARRLLPGTF